MNTSTDIVFSIIKSDYLKRKAPVPVYMIYNLGKGKISNNKTIRNSLVWLHRNDKILMGNGTVTPILTNEDIQLIEKMKIETTVNLEKVKYCIKRFFQRYNEFPKPSEIEDLFLKEFGKPNIEDFTRHLRKLVEDSKLLRTDDFRYYYKGIELRLSGLKNWCY